MTKYPVASRQDSGSPFPGLAEWPESGGELVESLTYRQSYTPAPSVGSSSTFDPPSRHGLIAHAPWLLRTAAGAAWALVSVVAAGSVLVLLVLVLVRVMGWL